MYTMPKPFSPESRDIAADGVLLVSLSCSVPSTNAARVSGHRSSLLRSLLDHLIQHSCLSLSARTPYTRRALPLDHSRQSLNQVAASPTARLVVVRLG